MLPEDYQLQEHSLGRSIVALVLRQAIAVSSFLGNGLLRSAPSLVLVSVST